MFNTAESFNEASIEDILDCLNSIQKDEIDSERWLKRFYTWNDLMAYWLGMLHFSDINWSDVWEMCQPINGNA